ncbi:MAG: 5-formyltetrahydrofolate cyclo-ligase [Paludibacter sp.]|jgi:5-formyltetrahydrofolate cyclo-ligase
MGIMDVLFPFFSNSFEIDEEKKRIRFDLKHIKEDLSDEEKEIAAAAVFGKLESLSEFKSAKTIMIYWSAPDELPTQTFIKKWKDEKLIILPSIKGRKLRLKRYSSDVNMVQRALGIWEPDLKEIFDGKVDLVIVPGVAFDSKKNRLGRGKGYYDRFFRKQKTLKIGVGFDFQLINSVPLNTWDKRLDLILTPSNTIE